MRFSGTGRGVPRPALRGRPPTAPTRSRWSWPGARCRRCSRLFALDAALAALFVAGGLALNGDQAELFRELTPGTLLSFAQLLFIAAVAWAIHRRADGERAAGLAASGA